MTTALILAFGLLSSTRDVAYGYCAVSAADAPGEYYAPFVECLESIGWGADEAREEADTIRCLDDNMCCE
jgi:hypothetical protein